MKAMSNNESVKVGVRVRPMNERELQNQSGMCISTGNNNDLSLKEKQFIFDYVYGMESSQESIYDSCAYSIVENSLQGFNGTIFAYGQTGAGKTHTMVGDYKDQFQKGIIPRSFEHIITAVETAASEQLFIVQASFIQIYNEDIIDLMEAKSTNPIKKELKENIDRGIYVKDLKKIPVKSVSELFKVLDYGNKNRTVFATAMNAVSSRSHAIFTIHIESAIGKDNIKTSKLNLVDLAGSERVSKTEATGARLKQGSKINLSLSALGNVINALVEGKSTHIPYRDSKLTRLLQDSLGGNTKTLMIASVSPAEFNYDETLSTIRYAARARNIKNRPKVNEDPKDTMIREYLEEIENLKKQLQGKGAEGTIQEESIDRDALRQLEEEAEEKAKRLSQKDAEIQQMQEKLKEMQELIHKDKHADAEQIKKRKLKKKKAQKVEELLQKKILQLSMNNFNLESNQSEEKQINDKSTQELASINRKLKKKLKSVRSDLKDREAEFHLQRQDLNQAVRELEGELSFYRQLVLKFLKDEDIDRIKKKSVYEEEKREYTLPGFLVSDRQEVTLPKNLSKLQIQDLWEERRKNCQMQFLSESISLDDLDQIQDFEKEVMNREKPISAQRQYKNYNTKNQNPFLQNRKIFKNYDYQDSAYQQKEIHVERADRMFRRTDYRLAEMSGSKDKNSVYEGRRQDRSSSRKKLDPLPKDYRPLSREYKIGIPRPNKKSVEKGFK